MWVYILECSDDSYYTGVTNDLDRRLEQHNSDGDKKSYTHSRRPVKLVFCEEFKSPNEAIMAEKQIKGWTRRKKKALIEGDIEKLKEYSKNYSEIQINKSNPKKD
ncbi:MAG: GIY-YIG nuclease family protein [Ignavibacteria bacterium]|nr:GIY-YIG nuclease family protein [Ignavibacteria bacterium]MBK9227585.1 GIY-YIG nuclease family protein [Ignavibacteria bacterium]